MGSVAEKVKCAINFTSTWLEKSLINMVNQISIKRTRQILVYLALFY